MYQQHVLARTAAIFPRCSRAAVSRGHAVGRSQIMVSRRTFFTSFRSSKGSHHQQSHHYTPPRDPGLAFTSVLSDPQEVPGPKEGVPSRAEQVRRLQQEEPYDVLIIGAGATGAGCALDAASRGLKVACIERGDFGSETSSRSTKLIWAGIKYMATASASFLSTGLFTDPLKTWRMFWDEMHMVLACHRERHYMTVQQQHLCHWIPIAVPFFHWHISPPPFGHVLFGYFPILAPFVLKFYDALSGFSCPSSYIMRPGRAKEQFPQLARDNMKYCAVFYEAQHNDARTNLAIALSAAEYGAHIANYVEMTKLVFEKKEHRKTIGVTAVDRMTGRRFTIFAKKIIFAGGPFTDGLRAMEYENDNDTSAAQDEQENKMKPAVRSASGTHIVLPGYYCPKEMGLLDYNTSDGRFLFFTPWQGHTLVGTTDTKNPAETLPGPPEDEVQWLLNECSKYLSKDLHVRRSDVLSAWRGWRPLAVDPHASPDGPVSRDHIISENPKTGVIFVAGGKWTTWREMAEQTIDHIVGPDGPKCRTLDIRLFGAQGYVPNLAISLIQKYGMAQDVAEHLVRTYAGQAWRVCELSQPTHQLWPRFGLPLAPNYPYIDAEVVYACREYACTIEDVLSRRTRLACLNKDAALAAIPIVAKRMAQELKWTDKVMKEQIKAAKKYVESYGGRIPTQAEVTLREGTYHDLTDVFRALDMDGNGILDRRDVGEVAEILGFPMSDTELKEAFAQMDPQGSGRVTFDKFEIWWNHQSDNHFHRRLSQELGLIFHKDGVFRTKKHHPHRVHVAPRGFH